MVDYSTTKLIDGGRLKLLLPLHGLLLPAFSIKCQEEEVEAMDEMEEETLKSR